MPGQSLGVVNLLRQIDLCLQHVKSNSTRCFHSLDQTEIPHKKVFVVYMLNLNVVCFFCFF